MRESRLYVDAPLTVNASLRVTGATGHYLDRVLRRRPGDRVRLFNGTGGDHLARVTGVHRGAVDLQILEHLDDSPESPLSCHLGLALSRGERMDWAIQKCTELGISTVTPLLVSRCERRPSPAQGEKKRAHWQKVAQSACEQSGRDRIPAINPLAGLDTWLGSQKTDVALVCAPGAGRLSPDNAARPGSVSMLIGPEGGLTTEEINLAEQAGFTAVGLGPRILRTETAPVVLLGIVQHLWGDV